MKKVIFVLWTIFFLFIGIGTGCGTKDNDEKEVFNLIAKMREYFDIATYEATDHELRIFLQDEANRIFIEGTVRQIAFGQKVLQSRDVSKPAEIELLNFMSSKMVFAGLQQFLNRLTSYPVLGTPVNTLITI